MADPIRVIIKGSDATGTDAPTVDDLLGQVRDFVEVLRGVERALEPDKNQIVWRVTNVTKNSPIAIELTPFPSDPAAFVDVRAARVEQATADGLRALQGGVERPPYFTADVLPHARKLHQRVTNGLSDTTIRFSSPKIGEPIQITARGARLLAKLDADRAENSPVPYRELGSLEGYFAGAELDGMGRPILWFRHRLDGVLIKAIATGSAFKEFEGVKLGDVWSGARIRVFGVISYTGAGAIESLKASGIEVLDQGALPTIDEIIDPNFTGGLTTEEFLGEIRNG